GPQGPRGQPGPPGPPGAPGPRKQMDINAAIQALIESNTALQMESYQNTEVTLIDHSEEIFKTLNYLSNLLHSIKNPLGTRDNPARICKDLLNCEQKVSDGKYWIDPNLGCPSDAIEVFCNFSAGGQTCLPPVSVTKKERWGCVNCAEEIGAVGKRHSSYFHDQITSLISLIRKLNPRKTREVLG
ncbi:COL24A1 isoform 5, partial [Pongo abelii]